MTIQELQKEFDKCKEQLVQLGYTSISNKNYELVLNNRLTFTMGQCVYIKGWQDFRIEISSKFLEMATLKQVQEVLMHELCHTLRGCDTHRGRWKKVVKKVNERYGYNISRCSDFQYDFTPVRYIVRCQNCGAITEYRRQTQLVKELKQGIDVTYICCNCYQNKFTLEDMKFED